MVRPEARLIATVKIYVNVRDRGGNLSRPLVWSTKVDHGAHSVIVKCLPTFAIDSIQPLRADKHAQG